MSEGRYDVTVCKGSHPESIHNYSENQSLPNCCAGCLALVNDYGWSLLNCMCWSSPLGQ